MTRLTIEGSEIYFDDFDFEMKWKHPISNSLIGESIDYSTDISISLSAENKAKFDYQIFGDSAKTNKYLYGTLYVNGEVFPVRCYVKMFTPNKIIFYLEKFKTGGTAAMIRDETTIDELFLPAIQAGDSRDYLLNIVTGAEYTPMFSSAAQLADIFDVGTAFGRRYVYASTDLLGEIADFYGITLVDAPINYRVYCNQWKVKPSAMNKSGDFKAFTNRISFNTSAVLGNLRVNGDTFTSETSFKAEFFIREFEYFSATPEDVLIFAVNETSDYFLVNTVTGLGPETQTDLEFTTSVIPAGTYYLIATNNALTKLNVNGSAKGELYADIQEGDEDVPFSETAGFFPCWQNLPKITAKKLFELIAICAGKYIEYDGDNVNFIDFSDAFSTSGAIDVSEYLREWRSKSFRFLQSRTNNVVYSGGQLIASVIVNDETLPDTENVAATIDAIKISDDSGDQRNTETTIIQETTDGIFDIVSKLADVYTPAIAPKLFEAEFSYFRDNHKPLLIRQLGGVFIAIESVITTKKTIVLKLLKIL